MLRNPSQCMQCCCQCLSLLFYHCIPCTVGEDVNWRELTGSEVVQELWRRIKLFGKHVTHFPLTAWLVYTICVFYYVAVIPFIGVAM